jgi:hypothetical protein
MKIQPLFYLESLSDEQIARYECSDKIWVSRRFFEDFLIGTEVGVAGIARLSNRVGNEVYALVFSAHHGEDDVVYAPSWICAALELDSEDVSIARASPSLGTRIKIVPHTSDHLHAEDPQTLLRDAFENYTCLMNGYDYKLWLTDHAMTVTLLEIFPEGQDVICVRDCEIELELAAPLDRPATPPAPPAPVVEPEPAAPIVPAIPQPTPEERRAQMLAAVRRRLAEAALSDTAQTSS